MYGQVYSEDKGSAFIPGINENVSLISFGLTTTDQWGTVLDVVFAKDNSTLNCRKFQPTPKVREITVKGVKRMQSEEEAKISAFGDFNTWVKSIVIPFTTEEAYDEAMKDVTSFESFITACKTLLGDDFKNKTGRLIVGYNNKGFPEVPRALWVTGTFWTLDPEKELKISDKVLLVKPVVAATNSEQKSW